MSKKADNILAVSDLLADLAGEFARFVADALEMPQSPGVLFEIRAYFLHILDVALLASRQAEGVRELVVLALGRVTAREFAQAAGNSEGEMRRALDERLGNYGEVAASKGGAQYLQGVHSLLSLHVRATMLSGQVQVTPPVPLDAIQDFVVRGAMVKAETRFALPFRIAVHDLLKDNSDFTELATSEVRSRLLHGSERALDAVSRMGAGRRGSMWPRCRVLHHILHWVLHKL